MLNVNEVQAGMVARLKATTDVVALLPSANEIREDYWQGTTFAYPNVRVAISTLYPKERCNYCKTLIRLLVFSDQASSREANAIAAEINEALHNKSFSQGTVRYLLYSAGLVPAVRVDERSWRAEVLLRAIVEPA